MREYRWMISSDKNPKTAEDIDEVLLGNRGITTAGQRKAFFIPEDPLQIEPEEVGLDKDELMRAVGRVRRAIEKKEKVIVYGDYDADGVCATAIMWEAINRSGGRVLPYIPDRTNEGYGLNEDSIVKLKEADPQLGLIVTVDHGIVGHKKIDFAKELGVEVIVTDHHQPSGTKPNALAVVHTTVLSGAGVAWFMAREILKEKAEAREQMGLVAMGTIADLVPLVGANRSLVREGIEQLRRTERPGIKALMEVARVDRDKVETYEIGYILTPRLNAMGRLEHAIDSLRLLCTHDQLRARVLAVRLDEINRERQALTEETFLHAKQLLLARLARGEKSLVFIGHESYQQGVIGLVAGKLVEEYYRPTIVVAKGEKYSKGSARSVEGFDIIKSLREAEELMVDVGGHPMAAGFTIETDKLGILEERLLEAAQLRLGELEIERVLKVDVAIELTQINMGLYEELNKFKPYGQGNREPVFASFGVSVVDARVVGADGRHLKLTLEGPGSEKIEAIGFRLGHYYEKLSSNSLVDIAYNVSLETWDGQEKLQLKLKDFKING